MSRATARTAPLLAAALGGCAPSLAPEGLRIEQIGPLSLVYDVDPMFANDGAWVTSRWSNLTRWGETGNAG